MTEKGSKKGKGGLAGIGEGGEGVNMDTQCCEV